MSKEKSHQNTYGWARAEILGALVNSVFLIALCFTIFIEAIQRLTHSDVIEQVDLLLYVGIAGLVINLIGLVLFHEHAHGHSHASHEIVVEATTPQQTAGTSHQGLAAPNKAQIHCTRFPVTSHERSCQLDADLIVLRVNWCNGFWP